MVIIVIENYGKHLNNKTGQDKARHGKARQGKARQGKARQGKARQDEIREYTARRIGLLLGGKRKKSSK